MIPLFFKAIRPAEPAPDEQEEEQPASDIVPDEAPDGADGEDGAVAADPAADAQAEGAVDESADSVDEDAGSVDKKPGADAPPEATDPDDPDGAAGGNDDDERADVPMSNFTELLALVAERTSQDGGFGPDVVKPGHHVAFAAGDFSGSGKVAATGRDGAKVHDSSGREHSVHWREVTGHFAGDDDGDEAAAAAKPKAGSK